MSMNLYLWIESLVHIAQNSLTDYFKYIALIPRRAKSRDSNVIQIDAVVWLRRLSLL